MIIGLTGTLCAGKGTVSQFLKQRGFSYYSLSDTLREYLDSIGLERTRENLINTANELREKHGAGILARWVSENVGETENAIVDGIRNPAEVEELRKRTDFYLLAIDAPIETRFERMQSRDRGEKDPKTFEEFKELDKSDKGIGQMESAQQTEKTMEMADLIFMNDGHINDFKEKIQSIFSDIQKEHLKKERPSWDDYFLKMALLVAERSTCRRHHIGAVIIKDKKVLSSGYNGAAAGAADCLKLGCKKDSENLSSGEFQEKCRAIHAEQNAIIQAAIHGASIEGATIYCTHSPCFVCAKSIANAKIKRVVTFSSYPDKSFSELFEELGIEYEIKQMPKQHIGYLP